MKPGMMLAFLDMQHMYATSSVVSLFCLAEDISTFTAFGEPVLLHTTVNCMDLFRNDVK